MTPDQTVATSSPTASTISGRTSGAIRTVENRFLAGNFRFTTASAALVPITVLNNAEMDATMALTLMLACKPRSLKTCAYQSSENPVQTTVERPLLNE